MKQAWIPVLVLSAACSTTSSPTRAGEARTQGGADCTVGCCDDDADCCAATSTVAAVALAAPDRTEPGPCCEPGSGCCAKTGDNTR
jgi:hypothetical protein